MGYWHLVPDKMLHKSMNFGQNLPIFADFLKRPHFRPPTNPIFLRPMASQNDQIGRSRPPLVALNPRRRARVFFFIARRPLPRSRPLSRI